MPMKKPAVRTKKHTTPHHECVNPPIMTPQKHEALMQKMGVSKEQDEEWRREHGLPPPVAEADGAARGVREFPLTPTLSARGGEGVQAVRKPVNCFAIGGGFLAYCVRQGWLEQEGAGRSARYFVTAEGRRRLEEFGIKA